MGGGRQGDGQEAVGVMPVINGSRDPRGRATERAEIRCVWAAQAQSGEHKMAWLQAGNCGDRLGTPALALAWGVGGVGVFSALEKLCV